jgi:hypothetical protein
MNISDRLHEALERCRTAGIRADAAVIGSDKANRARNEAEQKRLKAIEEKNEAWDALRKIVAEEANRPPESPVSPPEKLQDRSKPKQGPPGPGPLERLLRVVRQEKEISLGLTRHAAAIQLRLALSRVEQCARDLLDETKPELSSGTKAGRKRDESRGAPDEGEPGDPLMGR